MFSSSALFSEKKTLSKGLTALLEVELLKLPWPDWLALLNGIYSADAFMQALRQNSILTSNIADSSDEK